MNHRIDVHGHLIPGVDDGCASPAESVDCARSMVAAGYSVACCTPHLWPHLAHNTASFTASGVAALQRHLDAEQVALKLLPGGEISAGSMWPQLRDLPAKEIPTCGNLGRHALIDFWADELPVGFDPLVTHLQSLGMTVILAHPERISAYQRSTALLDEMAARGLLLQGNLQCFSEPEGSPARTLAEKWLMEGRYHLLGSDVHNRETLPARLAGLRRAIDLAGDTLIDRLTVHHPREILAGALQE